MCISLKEAARDAIAVQYACNLSGVVHSFSRHLTTLWGFARELEKGTDWVNQHPICQMFMVQIVWLTVKRSDFISSEQYREMSLACQRIRDEDEETIMAEYKVAA